MTAAEFERLTAAEAECLLRRRLNLFVNAGATPCAALVLAAQVEIPEEEAVCFLESGFSVDLTLRLLYEPAAYRSGERTLAQPSGPRLGSIRLVCTRQYVYFSVYSQVATADEIRAYLGVPPDEAGVRRSRSANPPSA